jgi:hypothetical protein
VFIQVLKTLFSKPLVTKLPAGLLRYKGSLKTSFTCFLRALPKKISEARENKLRLFSEVPLRCKATGKNFVFSYLFSEVLK